MTAVSVETPLAPAFSEDMAQTTLAKHLNNQVLTPLLWAFCANDLAESEHQLLLNNESLVCEEAANALRQVALRANASHDVAMAYFYHRKAELLSACLELGVSDFFEGLHDPEKAMAFFDRIGPPPGYDDDYWSRLVDSYKEGDHVKHQLRRQEYQPHQWQEMSSGKFETFDHDVSIVNDVLSHLRRKYRILPNSDDVLVLNLEETMSLGMESQAKERAMLLQEFVQTGLSLLLNWLLSLSPATRFSVLEQCIANDVILTSSLDSVLSSRQRRFLLPELADVPMLVGDGVDRLQQLLLRIASGQENAFAENPNFFEMHPNFTERFQQCQHDDIPLLMKELDLWAREMARQEWYNVPAVLAIEHLVETLCIAHSSPPPLPIASNWQPLAWHEFSKPFYAYRTRGLQLFALSLVERCLKTCLPPQQNPSQSSTSSQQQKKKKRPL